MQTAHAVLPVSGKRLLQKQANFGSTLYIHELLQLVCSEFMHYPVWSVCTQREAESKVKVLSKKCEKRLAVGPLPGAWESL